MCYGAGGFDAYILSYFFFFLHRKRIQRLTCTIISERTILGVSQTLPRILPCSRVSQCLPLKVLPSLLDNYLPAMLQCSSHFASFDDSNFASSVDLDNPISPQLSLPILNEPSTFLSFMVECFLQVDHHVRLKEKTPARLSLVYKPFLERLRFGLINPTNDIRIFECFPPSIFAWGMVRVRDAR